MAIALDEDLAKFNALLNGSRPSSTVIERTKTLNKQHSSNSNSNSNPPIPSPPTKKKSTDLKPPVLHFLDVESFIYILRIIVAREHCDQGTRGLDFGEDD